jgi:hypothetical protein
VKRLVINSDYVDCIEPFYADQTLAQPGLSNIRVKMVDGRDIVIHEGPDPMDVAGKFDRIARRLDDGDFKHIMQELEK